MRRRDVLASVAALPAWARAGRCDERFAPVRVQLRDGVQVVGPRGAQRWPLPTVAVAGGLWAGEGRALRRWRSSGGSAWSATAQATLDAPIHGLAASADGAHVLVAHGAALSLLDGEAQLLRRWGSPTRDQAPPRALFALAQRRSLLAAWPAQRELWEIQLDPQAPPIYDGLVHDWRLGEALPTPGHLGVRRIRLDEVPDLRFADPRAAWVAGVGAGGVHIVHLDVRRHIVTLPLPGAAPALAVLAPDPKPDWWLPQGPRLQIVDPLRWRIVGAFELSVQAMSVLGDRVLACADGGLQLWRDSRWREIAPPGGGLCALGRDLEQGHWLLAGDGALWRLDRDGQVVAGCAWPQAAQVLAIAGLAP